MKTGKANQQTFRAPDEMQELFHLCRCFCEEYSGPEAPRTCSDHDAKRRKLEQELSALCAQLLAMAMGQIAARSAAVPPAGIAEERRDWACRAVSLLFYLDSRELKPAVVNSILRFFDRHPHAGPAEIFKHLSGAVAISLRNVSKTAILEGGSLYAFTARHVNDFLAGNPRYRRLGRWIVIDPERESAGGCRAVMCRDLISLGSAPGEAFRTPERIAIDILEAIRELAPKKAWLHVGELRQAVYEIYSAQAARVPLVAARPNPEEDCSQNELCRIARSLVRKAAGEYSWKPGHSPETRSAFVKAACDKLEDGILLSEKGDSNFGYVEQHMPGLTPAIFEREYKGSFQHFWFVVFEKWRKFHART